MTHNNFIFKGGVVDLIDVIANIKVLSWNWFINRKGRHSGASYSEWCSNPLGCSMIGGASN